MAREITSLKDCQQKRPRSLETTGQISFTPSDVEQNVGEFWYDWLLASIPLRILVPALCGKRHGMNCLQGFDVCTRKLLHEFLGDVHVFMILPQSSERGLAADYNVIR